MINTPELRNTDDRFLKHPWNLHPSETPTTKRADAKLIIQKYWELRETYSARQAALIASALPVQSEVAA